MTESAKKLEGGTLQQLLSLVKEHTGITMGERKRDLLFARVRRRLRVLNLETPEQYLEYLLTSSDEVQEFVNLMTTNETLFFRTPVIWEYFNKEFLPEWYGKNPGEVLRVWSAASSSGEEACSIAMACEEFKLMHPSFRYRVYGSDISTDVLQAAKTGVFRNKSVEELRNKKPDFFHKYFRLFENGHKVIDPLMANMEFSIQHLHRRSPKIQFYDLVFLRNVLIYFDDADCELVLRNVYGTMKNQGVLILGESESLARLKTPFIFKKPLIYKRDT